MRKQLTFVVSVVAISLLVVLPAGAAPRGENGQIAFARYNPALDDTQIYTVNADGAGERRLSADAVEGPRWSPDGTQISGSLSSGGTAEIINADDGSVRVLPQPDPDHLQLYCGEAWSRDGDRTGCEGFGTSDPALNGVYTVRTSDGGGLMRVTTNPGGDDAVGDFSPDGNRLVFMRFDESALFVVNTNGTGLKQITPTGAGITSLGDWSPQGNEIVFSRRGPDTRSTIWVVHADGTGLHQIDVQPAGTCGGSIADPTATGCPQPRWSPDGTKIVFARGSNLDRNGRIYTVNADGTSLTQITSGPGDQSPDWATHQ